ncbi:PBP1A family penicillin-binding protein, partial [Patescibacteria group bacterium]|nr:PBP1A family penicillin-binding protein [Patescibacteria group bacterium]
MSYSLLPPPNSRKKGLSHKRRWKRKRVKLASALITAGFIFFILTLLSTAVVFGFFAREVPSPDKLTNRNVEQSTKILDREGTLLYNVHGDQNRTLVTLDKVPEDLRNATIAIEDQNFYKHKGFDIQGIVRSIRDSIFNKQLSGGSTLTQQLVKNALLTPERTITRKIKEFILAVQIERRFTKDQILQIYLNEIPYGGTAWGAEAAANQYFNKSVSDLDLTESAILAGLPQRPSVYSPFSTNPEAYIGRTKAVLSRMREDAYITQEQEEEALKKLPKIKFAKFGEGITAPHFALYVKQILEEKYGEKFVQEGGLQVTTTLDLKLQNMAQKVVKDEIKKNGKSLRMSNGSVVIQNTKTGEILAMVGSKDYFAKDIQGNFNVAAQGLRQPGSALKPFNYLTGFKKGYTPATMYLDIRTDFGGGYKPGNYDDRFHGPQSIRNSLGNSYNIPAVKMLGVNGVSDMIGTLQDFGITTLDDPNQYGLSLTLGGGAIKMLELNNAFATLGNLGKEVKPIAILKITDSSGKIIEEFNTEEFKKSEGKQVVTQEHAYLVDHILSDRTAKYAAYGTYWANRLNFRSDIAVKTGTSELKIDNWAFGTTPSYTVGVWVGNNDNSPMHPSISSGVTGAAPIWRIVIENVLKGKEVENFKRPAGIISMKVDSTTGQKPTKGSKTRTDIFTKWQPAPENTMRVTKRICKPSGLLANKSCEDIGKAINKTYLVLTDPYTEIFNSGFKQCKPCPPTKTDTKIYSTGSTSSLTISISSPVDGATTGVDFTVSANASGPNTITKVEFYVGGSATPDAVDTTSPYSASFTDVDEGNYEIKVIVYDSKNKTEEET